MQGAGSDSADTTLRFKINPSYWVSTGLIPSYDLTIVPTGNTPASYWPNCSEPVTRDLGTTGERDDIGIVPSWYVRHLFTQTASDEQVVRAVSLVGGHGFSIGLENSATLTYPCVNNGPQGNGSAYPGMPAPNPAFTWVATGNHNATDGFVDTTNAAVQLAGFSEQDTTHMPQFNYSPLPVYRRALAPRHAPGAREQRRIPTLDDPGCSKHQQNLLCAGRKQWWRRAEPSGRLTIPRDME